MSDARRIAQSGLFDASWYLRRYPDVAHLGLDPLDHFLRFGMALDRSPGPGFDADFYARSHPETSGRTLLHFLEQGAALGFAPLPADDLCDHRRNALRPDRATDIRAGLIRADLANFVLEAEFWLQGGAAPVLRAGRRECAGEAFDAPPSAAVPPGATVFRARLPLSDLDLEAGTRIVASGVSFAFSIPVVPVATAPDQPLAGPQDVVKGRLDHAGRRMAQGWAHIPGKDSRVELLLSVDGVPHAVLRTGLARPDVAEGSQPGFRIDLPPNLAPCAAVEVSVAPTVAKGVLTPARRVLRPSGTLFPLPAPNPVPVIPTGDGTDTVSVIILNRNGESLLRAFFDSARATGDLDGCEWIVIDHRSDDGSQAVCEEMGVRFIRRDGNFSFSESCNFGAGLAQGRILLFANNDLVLHAPFLPLLRRHFADGRCGILGAKLHDHAEGLARGPVQHLGVHIAPRLSGDVIRPFEARRTAETPDIGQGALRVPAVTGAFLAIAKDRFGALGGFDEGYVYGMEDVDLCLRALEAGMPVLCEHGFDITHHRGFTRDASPSRARRERNYQRFNHRWGAALRHAVPQDVAFWTGSRPVMAGPAPAPGVHVRDPEGGDLSGIDIAPETPHATGISPFIRMLPGPLDGPRPLRIGIKCPAPEAETARWGDFHFAESLATALGRLGHTVRVDCREHWSAPIGDADDVVIVLRGLLPWVPKPSQISILWVISHPGDLPPAEVEGYDLVWSASQTHADLLSLLSGRKVGFLPQCTDTDRFAFDENRIGARPDRVLFVGNARGVHRDAVRWSLERGIDLHLFGKGWGPFVPQDVVRAANIPNTVLADFYASSRIVLCDHWEDMRRLGFVSNRVMDVLAVGGRLAVDDVAGIESLLPGGYHIFRDAQGLHEAASAAPDLSPDGIEARRRIALHVHAHHSFDARARTLDVAIRERLLAARHTALHAGAAAVAGLYSHPNSAEFKGKIAGDGPHGET
ncbi:glycosyltransferase [Falsirhodobacter xinxiangensis]|uniref:glycosyltransferase n=1 Tax=Falsirhodobacter xinxiangensis TaxID=2530049 RepID=UPI0010A9CBDE|nr:glycosyltransferase [Rhodobacter xinxiangensis]